MALRHNSTALQRFGTPAMALTGILFCSTVWAAPGDVVIPYVQYSMSYDDNLLRVQDAATAQALTGSSQMSDMSRQEVAGVRINKTLSRQNITADVNMNRTNFDHFTQFDYQGKAAKANWNWALGEHFDGNLGTAYNQMLTPFQDFRVFEKNIRTDRSNYASGYWHIDPDWSLHAQYTRYNLGFQLLSQQPNTLRMDTSEAGVDYIVRSTSSVGMVFRHIRGSYPFQQPAIINSVVLDNNFKQNEVKANIQWQMSGKTRLQFLGGWVQRTKSDSGADFSGPNARLIANLSPTGKTLVTANLYSEIGGVDDPDANFALTKGASLTATWLATGKIRADTSMEYQRRDYNGATIVPGITPSNRRDQYRRVSLNLTYAPITPLSLVLTVYHEGLTSNITEFGYASNGVALMTRYEF
ncbi:MAG: biosynthesis protein [Herbaspirillum sp.]|jgi:exopolysaccharide biosynthesis operon protein EpsL|nr:biosynthesis protein [Herbaspirillum sp.]